MAKKLSSDEGAISLGTAASTACSFLAACGDCRGWFFPAPGSFLAASQSGQGCKPSKVISTASSKVVSLVYCTSICVHAIPCTTPRCRPSERHTNSTIPIRNDRDFRLLGGVGVIRGSEVVEPTQAGRERLRQQWETLRQNCDFSSAAGRNAILTSRETQ